MFCLFVCKTLVSIVFATYNSCSLGLWDVLLAYMQLFGVFRVFSGLFVGCLKHILNVQFAETTMSYARMLLMPFAVSHMLLGRTSSFSSHQSTNFC